jgi:putative DNA primase/helicase
LQTVWAVLLGIGQQVNQLSDFERQKMLEERDNAKAKHDAIELEYHNSQQQNAIAEYKKADTFNGNGSNNLYLLRKYITNFRAKESESKVLLFPLRDLATGDLLSVQTITDKLDNGSIVGSQKRFYTGVKLKLLPPYGLIINSFDLGLRANLNDLANEPIIYIVEGVATGCTVFEAVNCPVVCTFSANNIDAVSVAVKGHCPNAKIIVASDYTTEAGNDNVGLKKAVLSAKKIGGFVVKSTGINGSDFNDDYQNYGMTGGSFDPEKGLFAVRDSIRQQLDNEALPVVTMTANNVSISLNHDAPIQIMVVCENQVSYDLARKMITNKQHIHRERMAGMLATKAQIKTIPLVFKKERIDCPVIWVAFGSNQAWIDCAVNVGMIAFNDVDLLSTGIKSGFKQVASFVNTTVKDCLNELLPTGINAPMVTIKPIFDDVTARRSIPSNTLENWYQLLEWEGVNLRYNVMSRDIEIRSNFGGGKVFGSDLKNSSDIAQIASAGERYELQAKTMLPQYMLTLSSDYAFHPVKDWIERKPWDKVSRLFDFVNVTLITDDKKINHDFKTKLVIKWMLGALQAIIEDKPKPQHGVLVLQGLQGLGKTAWIRALCPLENAVKDGMMLNPANVDSVRESTRSWITELGELDGTFKKSDIANLKAFLTKSHDSYRLPYHVATEDYPRRTAFIASVNEEQYLIDATGNRRFWTIPVDSIDYDHSFDMQQVWAEVYELYKTGGIFWLEKDDIDTLNGHNADFEAINPYEEIIRSSFYFDQTDKFSKLMTATDICIRCGYDSPNKATATAFGKALSRLRIGQQRKMINGDRQRFWVMPEPK